MIRSASLSLLLLLLLLLPQALHRELMYEGIHVDSISGDQPNSARTAAVDNFRAGKTWVLIATDLIGRGEEHRQCKQHCTHQRMCRMHYKLMAWLGHYDRLFGVILRRLHM
jgi:hypothetical protein